MIVTISDTLEAPTRTILELLRDLPEVPVLCHPLQGRSTIGGIDFEAVECGPCSQGDCSQGFPEADPLGHSLVFINNFTLLEAECGIRVHGRGLNERLELIARVSGGTLNTQNALDWLLTKHGIAETVGDMRELLLFGPLDIELGTLIMIVVMSNGALLKSLLVVDLLSLREPCAGGLPPSVVEIEEHVVQVSILVSNRLNLIEVRGDVADLVEILGSHLTDVQVDHVAIVGIDLS